MEEMQVEVHHSSNGYPSYESFEFYRVVEGDLKIAALEILGEELEKFSDAEICDGITVSANVTDGTYFRIYSVNTDGLFSPGREIDDLSWVEERMVEKRSQVLRDQAT